LSYLSNNAVPPTPANTGVYGYAAEDASARGVTGESTAGYGVSGIATTGRAVNGAAAAGVGVFASATTGLRVLQHVVDRDRHPRPFRRPGRAATSTPTGPKVGTALMVVGRARFLNCVGVATIAKGTKTVVVTPGLDLLAHQRRGRHG